MEKVKTPSGTTVSFDKYGKGPALVLVHGGFSDHLTNWQECKEMLAERFTVYAVARRGRGESSATTGHSLDDEMEDTAAVVRAAGDRVFLLGHSYGAVCALGAAALVPERVAKLILYEPPAPGTLTPEMLQGAEDFAAREDWDGMVDAFMRLLQVPDEEIAEIRATPFWDVWTKDAKATMKDLQALVRHTFRTDDYRALEMPVLLLVGSESPRELYYTDALAAVLPDSRIVTLEGTAHEGMTMVPEQFVQRVAEFLLD
jgi:pimeloyl-ACP methyl ester carboxylesterase